MRSLCIYGAGAIGLDLAWNAIQAGHQVTVIARGQSHEALKNIGIRHLGFGQSILPASDFQTLLSPDEGEPQDLIFLTTKVDDLTEVAGKLGPLLHPKTVVVSATNGIPPWFSYLQEETIGRFEFTREPREKFLASLPINHLLGGIVGRSAELADPGVIARSTGRGFTIGELDHQSSERTSEVAKFLGEAGFSIHVSENIHRDIWLKLIGNVVANPLSVIMHATVGEMLAQPQTFERMRRIAAEAVAVGLRLGVLREGDFHEGEFFEFFQTKLSHHRPSMLQDFLKGKPLEVNRILDVVEMFARVPGPVPPVDVPEIEYLQDELRGKIPPAEMSQGLST